MRAARKKVETAQKKGTWENDSDWAIEILNAIEDFIDAHGRAPTHLSMHPKKLSVVDTALSHEQSLQHGKFEVQRLGVFACDLAEVQIESDETLAESEFLLSAYELGNDFGRATRSGFFVQSEKPSGKSVAQQALPKTNLRSQLKLIQGGKK